MAQVIPESICFMQLVKSPVVIGILIALQINNWNENRKLAIKEKETLQKLIFDLEYDIFKFRELDSIYNSWMQEVNFIKTEVLTGKMQNLTSASHISAGRGSLFYLSVRRNTYDEMINTGILYSIRSEVVSSAINNYYELAKFEIEKVNRDNQDFADYALAPSAKDQKIIVMRLIEQNNLEHIDWKWLQDPNSEMYKHLETTNTWFKYAILANQAVFTELTSKANFLIDTMEEYLE